MEKIDRALLRLSFVLVLAMLAISTSILCLFVNFEREYNAREQASTYEKEIITGVNVCVITEFYWNYSDTEREILDLETRKLDNFYTYFISNVYWVGEEETFGTTNYISAFYGEDLVIYELQ